jgi:hypothetical protein
MYEENPLEHAGYWFSPPDRRGRRVPIAVLGHYAALRSEPETFGLTKAQTRFASIKDLEALSKSLIDQGWVRYRHTGTKHLFQTRTLQKAFIDFVLSEVGAGLNEQVVIETDSPRREYRGTINEWYDRSILGSWEANPQETWRIG